MLVQPRTKGEPGRWSWHCFSVRCVTRVFRGRAEPFAFCFYKRGELFDVSASGNHEVKFGGFVAEELPVNPGPDQTAIGSNVYFRNAQANRGPKFAFGNSASGGVNCATGVIDSSDFLSWDGGAPVQNEGKTLEAPMNFRQTIQVETLIA